MSNTNKKRVIYYSFTLGIILTAFLLYSNKPNSYTIAVLYGLSVGSSIALGCSFISNFFLSKNKTHKNNSENYMLLVICIAVFIFTDAVVVNLLWAKVLILSGNAYMNMINPVAKAASILAEFAIGMTGYLIILSGNFSSSVKKHYLELGEIKNELSKYKYETLKTQLNPHFLFNMLNTLSGLIHIDLVKSDSFIHHFSLLYRYALKVEPEDVVKLEQELEFIDHFLFLNNIRFDDAISSRVLVDNTSQYIVPMALQLAFENAIKHNQFNKTKPLLIEVSNQDQYLKISNNKSIKVYRAPSNNLGILILKARYARLSDVPIKIEEDTDTFTLFLPILEAVNS